MRHTRALLLLLALAAPAGAQNVVTSANPDRVAVTVYRNPADGPEEAMDRRWLGGFALVSETRQVTLQPGESEVRFEGVAGGIIPQSAIVTGFPDGIVERNRDAYLLSPGTLVDRSLGRRVAIRRTSAATGRVTEAEAEIRGTANGVVLQTAEGFEALRCTGLDETLIMSEVPPGLSPRPTLSVRARAAAPITATVTLSYLASGFDWRANYIVNLAENGRRADVFAWLTLASRDETSFPEADVQAVAGQLNRRPVQVQPREGGPLVLRCWPSANTSQLPREEFERRAQRGMLGGSGDEIVVTGSRMALANAAAVPVTVITAEQEELGDLKLYRVPEQVTLAANSQKQVALLHQAGVDLRFLYRQRIQLGVTGEDIAQPARRLLVTRNRINEGLGLPLPAGQVQVFAARDGRPFLIGQGFVADRAVGEDVEIALGEAQGIFTRLERIGKRDEFLLTVSNDGDRPIRFEAELAGFGTIRDRRLPQRNGMPLWAANVPANGTATLRFRTED